MSNNWSSGTYAYDGAGNVTAIGGQWYVYDKVSRLTQANLGGADTRRYAFDPFGNITRISTETVGKDHAPAQQIAVDATSNRLAASSYDAAGNQTTWGGYHYAWYPTSQMRQMQGDGIVSIHGYSADGERIGTYTVGGPFAGGITYTLRDLSGKVIREVEELGGVWSWKKDYVYRDGQQLASVGPGGVVKHFHLDHLGTVRRITDGSQAVVASHDYWPFGEEATDPYADAERMKFTGHERDLRDPEKTTDDLDYMHARYYSPNLGRFLAVDAGASVPRSAQSWNRYSYARANPVKLVDPDGRVIDTIFDVGCIVYDLYDIGRSLLKGEGVSASQVGAFGADVAGALVPFATGGGLVVRVGSNVDDAVRAARIAENAAEGRRFEQVAEELGHLPSGPKQAIPSQSGTAAHRVPDGMTPTRLVEVKHTAGKVRLTNQIRDFLDYANATGRQVVLVVNDKARLSKDMQKLVDEGKVSLVKITEN